VVFVKKDTVAEILDGKARGKARSREADAVACRQQALRATAQCQEHLKSSAWDLGYRRRDTAAVYQDICQHHRTVPDLSGMMLVGSQA
jgi:hypothetical protein